MKIIFLFLTLMLFCLVSWGQQYPAYVLTPPTTTNTRSNTSFGWESLCVSNNSLFFYSRKFNALEPDLWKTDGSAIDTKMVKEMQVSSNRILELVDLNGIVISYYLSNFGTLAKSDGTASGTSMFKENLDLRNIVGLNKSIFKSGSYVYFINNTAIEGSELWRTDGTAIGTTIVKDITLGSSSTTISDPVDANGTLFFIVGNQNKALWKTDGTEAGTVLVKSFNVQIGSLNQKQLIHINGTLYFYAINGTERGLWKSDGTLTGTSLVMQLGYCENFANVNNSLYFSGNEGDSVYGTELYKSDGTTNGTVLVKDLNPGNASAFPSNLTNVSGTLFFVAYHPSFGKVLWKSDGTALGTTFVKDVEPNNNTYETTITGLYPANSKLYFTAANASGNNTLWKSDGTTAGTDILLGYPNGANPNTLTEMNSVLYFVAYYDGVANDVLWRTDGTAEGTFPIDERRALTPATPLNIGSGVEKGSEIIFQSAGGLWKSDGTNTGTVNIKPTNVNKVLNNVNETVFFVGFDNTNGLELWKTDGTIAGTTLVKDIELGAGESSIAFASSGPIKVGNQLFFIAVTSIYGQELWKSDGTTGGTVLVKDINVGGHSNILEMIEMNGKLYFIADDGVNGRELWRSDGTAAGTYIVKETTVGSLSRNPYQLTVMNNHLYFRDFDKSVWKSDGTSAGTNIMYTFPNGTNLEIIGSTSNLLYLRVDGYNLWKSDGTNTGTSLVRSFTNPIHFNPQSLNVPVSINSALYFKTFTGIQRGICELWRTDGTDASTSLIASGDFSFVRKSLHTRGSEVYFIASINDSGYEIWKTSGTPAGTVLTSNIDGGVMDSNPTNLIFAGNNLFFEADFHLHPGGVFRISTTCSYVPSAPTASGITIQSGTRTVLNSSACLSGQLQWNSQASGGTVLESSNSMTTPILFANKTYYIACETNLQCQSPRTAVVVTVINPCPTSLSIATPNYTTEALTREASATAGAITATNQVTNTAQIIYQAKSVTLLPGFRAQPSATGTFKAQAGGCN